MIAPFLAPGETTTIRCRCGAEHEVTNESALGGYTVVTGCYSCCPDCTPEQIKAINDYVERKRLKA